MKTFQTSILLSAIIVVAILVAASLKNEWLVAVEQDELTYVDVILAQYGCTVSEASKIDDEADHSTSYRCHEGTDNDTEIFIYTDTALTKDFNADGKKETFIAWGENFGGTYVGIIYGIFDGADTIKSRTNARDRVSIETVYFENGIIVVDLKTHGQDDALCCPTVAMTKKFQWDGQALIPYPQQPAL